jgi:large subunit ribosomal protein L3
MRLGIIGLKRGMTRVFTADGASVPVSVIEVHPNRVTQVKRADGADGYNAIQVTYGNRRASLVGKAAAGHFRKASQEPGLGLKEFRVSADDVGKYAAGDQITASLFSEGQVVDVQGTSKGKGFQGTIKRHNFTMGDATHGNSLSHRAPGSIGQRQTPGRVFPGKKMSGHMGDEIVTAANLKVVRVDEARNLLLIRGAIPGAPGGAVVVRPAAKA